MFVSDHQAWKLVHAWKIEASYMVPEDLGFVMECMWSFFWIDLSLFFLTSQWHLPRLVQFTSDPSCLFRKGKWFWGEFFFTSAEVIWHVVRTTDQFIWVTLLSYLKKGKGDGLMGWSYITSICHLQWPVQILLGLLQL